MSPRAAACGWPAPPYWGPRGGGKGKVSQRCCPFMEGVAQKSWGSNCSQRHGGTHLVGTGSFDLGAEFFNGLVQAPVATQLQLHRGEVNAPLSRIETTLVLFHPSKQIMQIAQGDIFQLWPRALRGGHSDGGDGDRRARLQTQIVLRADGHKALVQAVNPAWGQRRGRRKAMTLRRQPPMGMTPPEEGAAPCTNTLGPHCSAGFAQGEGGTGWWLFLLGQSWSQVTDGTRRILVMRCLLVASAGHCAAVCNVEQTAASQQPASHEYLACNTHSCHQAKGGAVRQQKQQLGQRDPSQAGQRGYHCSPAVHLLALRMAPVLERLHIVEKQADHGLSLVQVPLYLCRLLRHLACVQQPDVLARGGHTHETAAASFPTPEANVEGQANSPTAGGCQPGSAAPRRAQTPSGAC